MTDKNDLELISLELILLKYGNAVLDARSGKANPTLGELLDVPREAIVELVAAECQRARIDELENLDIGNNFIEQQVFRDDRIAALSASAEEGGKL